MNIQGTAALVTGGGSGLGEATARELARLGAKVAVLDDSITTPAHRFNDGQNYDPTNKWVLFGHHFAALAGSGPLIGPVLAAQFGWAPGFLWLLAGVCLAASAVLGWPASKLQKEERLVAGPRRDGADLAPKTALRWRALGFALAGYGLFGRAVQRDRSDPPPRDAIIPAATPP